MEHNQTIDITIYKPNETEKEKAANSYLMSLIAVMAGTPLPITYFLPTLIFFLSNRKSTPYVKWHITQALLSQITMFIINAVAFTWTINIFFLHNYTLTDSYIGYIITMLTFNIFEFIITLIAAIRVRRGVHMEWPFWGTITNIFTTRKIPV